MADDKKKSDTRRSSDRRADDRREKADRRNKSDRRYAESRRGGNSQASKESSGARKSSPKEKAARPVGTALPRIIKKAAMAFSIVLLAITGLLIYFFANFEFYMEKVGQKVSIEMTKATIDPESLTDRITRARLFLKINNQLPFAIVFQNLKLNVKLSGYTIAKGIQTMPRVTINASGETIVPIQFHVDSIMTRRGLQKAVEKNTGPLLKSFLARLQGKNEAITDNLKGVIQADGSAEFRLVIGGIEVPFTRLLNFNQGS